MTDVTRLVIYVDLDDGATDARQLALSARLEAVLEDGRGLVLLDDRGWSVSGPAGIRERISTADLERDARMVVGPDEPFDGRTGEQMAADHWGSLAAVLTRQGVVVDARELVRLRQDVVLGERLRAWLRTG